MGKFSIRNIDWKAVGNAVIEVIRSIGRGDLILRMRVDKFFPYILYTFALAWASIWLSFKVEQAMLTVEKNKKTISELKITHAKKTYDLVKLNRLSTVESMLEGYESDVKAPDKPADILK